MGPPKTSRNPRPPSRSRFQEGSMNDRASAAPPIFFVDPDSVEAATHAGRQHYNGGKPASLPFGFEKLDSRQPTEPGGLVKRGSKQFLGQMWDGVLERFRFRKDAIGDDGRKNNKKTHTQISVTAGHGTAPVSVASPPPPPPPKGKTSRDDDRPSKEEVYANYHQLVASGFFSSHAIQSTRQPGPPAMRPTPSPTGAALRTPNTTPQWPLTPTPQVTPVRGRPSPAHPQQPPTSVTSSRGKKRPSISMNDDEPAGGESDRPSGNTLHMKKIRRTASRDIAPSRTRSTSRTIGLRSFSNARVPSTTTADEQLRQQKREPNKLIKRVPSRLPVDEAQDNNSNSNTPTLLQVPRSSSRRNVSESYYHHHNHNIPSAAVPVASQRGHVITAPDGSTRVLRPRRSAAEPLRVRPDANCGVPAVPGIPGKFTYGEDRENDGPWKGLRRTRAT